MWFKGKLLLFKYYVFTLLNKLRWIFLMYRYHQTMLSIIFRPFSSLGINDFRLFGFMLSILFRPFSSLGTNDFRLFGFTNFSLWAVWWLFHKYVDVRAELDNYMLFLFYFCHSLAQYSCWWTIVSYGIIHPVVSVYALRSVWRYQWGVIIIRISKKIRQHNGKKKKGKRTNNDLQNIHIKLKIE